MSGWGKEREKYVVRIYFEYLGIKKKMFFF